MSDVLVKGGELDVLASGSARATSVTAGGTVAVGSGGVARQTIVREGMLLVSRGALVQDTVLQSGGVAEIGLYASMANTTIAGGRLLNQGLANQTLIKRGAEVVLFGGVDTSAVVRSTGRLFASRGASVLSASISNGGAEIVSSGASDSATMVGTSGVLSLGPGAEGFHETVSGASAVMLATGSSHKVEIQAGGELRLLDHGAASGSLVDVGGVETVLSGGVTLDARLFGGQLMVSSGGIVSGGLSIQGGVAVIAGTMATGQAVKLTGSGAVLELANLAAFRAKISGLATSSQKIDLDGFAFSAGETVAWTQAGTSGTLVVHDGAKVARLTLIGAYATSDFKLANDGHGGTFVTRVQPAAALAQAVAGMTGARDAIAAGHAGGRASVSAPASPLAATATSGY
jgi:autotransporter passenger strand-loop-strand repeat protein